MFDVARLAGVSAQTVSRVARGEANVAQHTREKVLTAMASVQYRPNRAARALRTGRFGVIGLLTQHIWRTGEAYTSDGVVDEAAKLGYSVSLVQVHNPMSADVHQAVARLSQQEIDGLVIVQAGLASSEHLALPEGLAVASADLGSNAYPLVVSDHQQGVRAAVHHLLALGHPTVHHITGASDSRSAHRRQRLWEDALREAGAPIPAPIPGDWTAHSGYEAGIRIADRREVSAVFAANDEVALGLIRAFTERGIGVPDEISVVGYDGIELAEFSAPPLTTVRQDFHRVGTAMVQLIHQQLTSELTTSQVIVPTELIVRSSTGPWRPRG